MSRESMTDELFRIIILKTSCMVSTVMLTTVLCVSVGYLSFVSLSVLSKRFCFILKYLQSKDKQNSGW